MSEPEIARRCPSCGASIRDKAFFCPQCGQEIDNKTAALHDTLDKVKDVTLTEADFQAFLQPHLESPTKRLTPPPAPKPVAKPSQPLDKPPEPVDKPSQPVDKPPEPVDKPPQPVAHRTMGEVGARIQRATNKARDVEGNVVQRVQKFREISSVVIDEAGYDPSLRFVLVAAVLFILFLVIVLLNKMVG